MALTAEQLLIRIRGERTGATRALRGSRREVRGFSNDVRVSRVATTAMTGSAQSLALALGAVGGVAWAFGASARAAINYERELKKVETLVGVNRELVQKWAGDMRRMAPELGRGPVELAQALFVVTSAGERTARAMDIVRMSAQASAVGLGETKDIARVVTAAMQAYRKSGLDAAVATDILVTTVREGNLEAASLAGSLGRVLGIAAEAGVSFQQVGAFIATFTRVGVGAEEAVTALRGTINLMLKPSKQARIALAQFGLTIQDVRRAVREQGMARTLVELVNILREDDEALTQVIPNVRALSGVLATAGAQSEEFLNIAEGFETSLADTRKAFEDTATTSGHAMDRIRAQVEVVKIAIGEGLTPAIVQLGQATVESSRGLSVFATGLGLTASLVGNAVRVIWNSADTLADVILNIMANATVQIGELVNRGLIGPINKFLDFIHAPIRAMEIPLEKARALVDSSWEGIQKNIKDVDDAITDVTDQAVRFALALEGQDPALVTMTKLAEAAEREAAALKEGTDAITERTGVQRGMLAAARGGGGRGGELVIPTPAMAGIQARGLRDALSAAWRDRELWAAIGEDFKRELQAFLALATDAVRASEPEWMRFRRVMFALDVAVAEGVITHEEYRRAVEHLGKEMEETRISFETLAPAAASVVAAMIRAIRGEGGGFMGFLSGVLGAGATVASFFGGPGTAAAKVAAGLTAGSILAGGLAGGGRAEPVPVRITEVDDRAARRLTGPSEVNYYYFDQYGDPGRLEAMLRDRTRRDAVPRFDPIRPLTGVSSNG